ncbi:hypothetical protein CDAR_315141 [Caerostris darwini]|uniref:Uncharacterized protein n=1 Tax=Caerostris darwini TaxID=1538125 RepID=A0AAV4TRX7_9ARAC|nr:hypothetical protein CDAR_315141 [Caerostris darwini]
MRDRGFRRSDFIRPETQFYCSFIKNAASVQDWCCCRCLELFEQEQFPPLLRIAENESQESSGYSESFQ